jgi:hypothetical protein
MPEPTHPVRDMLFDLAPEFETTDTAGLTRIDRFIGYALVELDAARYEAAETDDEVTAGDYLNRANALLAAHLLTMRTKGGSAPAGPVESKREGDRSISYATMTNQPFTAFDTTSYGREFNRFRRSIFPAAIGV